MTSNTLVLVILGLTGAVAWGVAIRDIVLDARKRSDSSAASPRHAPGASPDEAVGAMARRDRDDDRSRSRRVPIGRHASRGGAR